MWKYVVILFCLLFSGKAFSDLHFEPYTGLGVLFKSESGQAAAQSLKENFYTKVTLGARAGYSKAGLAFGLDVNAGYHHPPRLFRQEKFLDGLAGAFCFL